MLGPLLLPSGSHSQYAPLFGLVGALLAGGVLASGLEGLGLRARSALRLPGLRHVDGLLGAALTACVGLGIAWIVGAVALAVHRARSRCERDIQRSAILRELDQLLPPSGPILNALARFDPLPSVRGPAADVPPPTRGILGAPAACARRAQRRARTRVRRAGSGSRAAAGSPAPGLVSPTHTLSPARATRSCSRTGSRLAYGAQAVVVRSSRRHRGARVPGLSAPALRLASDPRTGTAAAILGYPLDGPYDAEPGRLGQTQRVSTEDAYGNGPVLRSITSLRGRVRPGNSGGPMVDAAGQVVATVFAAITGAGPAQPRRFCRPGCSRPCAAGDRADRDGRGWSTGAVCGLGSRHTLQVYQHAAAHSSHPTDTPRAGGGLHTARP